MVWFFQHTFAGRDSKKGLVREKILAPASLLGFWLRRSVLHILDDAFDQLDRNHDGFISREEAAGTNLANDFDALDTNRDGKLSPGEATSRAARGSSSASGASFSDDKRGVGGSTRN